MQDPADSTRISQKAHSKKLFSIIFTLPRILGIFPYQFKDEKIELNLRLTLFHLIIYLSASTLAYFVAPIPPRMERWKINLWYFIDYSSMNACNFAAVWWLTSNKESVALVISVIEKVEVQTQIIRPGWRYSPNKFHLYFNAVLFCFIAFTYGMLCMRGLGYIHALSHFGFCLLGVVNVFVMVQHNALQRVLTSLFRRILSLLNPWLIVKCHEALCTASSSVSDIYGPGLFFLCFNCFFSLIWHLFFATTTGIYLNEGSLRQLWVISNISRILEMIRTSNMVRNEVMLLCQK